MHHWLLCSVKHPSRLNVSVKGTATAVSCDGVQADFVRVADQGVQ